MQKLPEVEERLMRELLASAIASIVYSAESACCLIVNHRLRHAEHSRVAMQGCERKGCAAAEE